MHLAVLPSVSPSHLGLSVIYFAWLYVGLEYFRSIMAAKIRREHRTAAAAVDQATAFCLLGMTLAGGRLLFELHWQHQPVAEIAQLSLLLGLIGVYRLPSRSTGRPDPNL